MTKKITRKVNGRSEFVVVSDKKADAMISKGWTLPVEPKQYESGKQRRKLKLSEDE